MKREQELLLQLQQACFVLHELVLYLDTHPDHHTARAAYHDWQKKVQALTERYEKEVGALTAYSVPADAKNWNWAKAPWPWQNDSADGEMQTPLSARFCKKGGMTRVDV